MTHDYGAATCHHNPLTAELNRALQAFTYKPDWVWTVSSGLGEDPNLVVYFQFPTDDANRPTQRLVPYQRPYEYFIDSDPIALTAPYNFTATYHGIWGYRSVLVESATAASLIKDPILAAAWLRNAIEEIERHEFEEFFRHRATRTCVVDPHPKLTGKGKFFIPAVPE